MGGIIIIFSALLSTLACAKLNFYVTGAVLTTILFAVIGFMDDWQKIKKKSNQAGLTAKEKFALQCVFAFFVALILYFHHFDTYLFVPFYKHPLLNMHWFAVFFWAFVIVGMSNAVNLTDGLDGLATVPSIFAYITLMIFAYFMGNAVFSKYLLLPFEYGIGETVIFASAMIGSLLGFLWYNAKPAEIFMGDSGSLPIGASIGYMAILTKTEILLALTGFIFIIETLSVMLQVGIFKATKKVKGEDKGVRIFKKAPIHHHFEEMNWPENKVTIRFWIIALITNIIAILSIKIR
jgi:phospho-N-acetylmuramoyl-pentapeptide-transferase